MSRLFIAVVFAAVLPATLVADILVLRDGTRIQGELLSVRGNVIEFQEQRGFGRGRTFTIERHEVVRIEFDDRRPSSGFDTPSGGRPLGLRERQVSVPSSTPWTDTGIDVRSGQTIYFEASGEVRWGRDRRDGPEGERNSPSNPARPIPNRPAAALIAKIGNNSTDYFLIGNEQGPIRVRSSGRLFLGVNDDFLPDNSGSFRVIVYY
jgi:hypothetical protein